MILIHDLHRLKEERAIGDPDIDLVSTLIVERANLDIRTNFRRFTRLTNGHSKKAENHAHAFSIYAMVYNFCRPHGVLRRAKSRKTTLAMAAGLEERPRTMLEVVERMDPARELMWPAHVPKKSRPVPQPRN